MSSTQITLPSKPRVVKEEENTGVYEIDNLYPGYGHTLGNSLRRIILSSLKGAAVVSIKIKGVDHEFSTIDGVKEDVINIILNIKKLRFKMLTDEPQTIMLKVKGPKKVLAEDLEIPGQVELLTPKEQLMEITDSKEVEIELKLEQGLGFLPKEILQKDRVEIGVIIPDAVFSPIRRVNYEIENMRVGDRTDYNRLRIIIETDGSITPNEALEQSVMIMISQLKSIVGFQDAEVEPDIIEEKVKEEKDASTELMKILVTELELSARTENVLEEAGIRTLGGLVRKNEEDILGLPGLGQKGLQEIKDALSEKGLSLRS